MNKAEALQLTQGAMLDGTLFSVGTGNGKARDAELAMQSARRRACRIFLLTNRGLTGTPASGRRSCS